MGILSGTETLFFCLGVLGTLLGGALVVLQKTHEFRWYANLLAAIGIFLLLFTIAWSVSSVLEGEPQAANMGLLVFGLPTLLLLGVTRRLVRRRGAEASSAAMQNGQAVGS